MLFKLVFITAIMVNYSLKVFSTGQSYEMYKIEQKKLVLTFRPLNNTERGFQSTPRIDNIDDMTVTELKSNINRAYMDIQCGYIFSAQIYMRLIEGLLMNKEQLEKVPQYTDLSFTKETAQMIATLYNVEAMRNTFAKNVMWIVLLFAERSLVYMKSVISGDPAEDQTTIVTVHKTVSLLLEHYMASDDCVDYMKNNKLDVEVNGNFDDLQGLLTTLVSKKSLIGQRLGINAENNISTAGYEQFSLNGLSLNGLLADIESTKRLLESVGVEVNWDGVLRRLKKEYRLGTQANGGTLSQQIDSLKTFNDKFILMVKVIIIRLMLKYATYIYSNRFDALMNMRTLRAYETEMLHDIVELESYMDIQHDKDVEYVKYLIKNIIVSLDVNNTIEKIKYFLNDFALLLYDTDTWRSFNVEKNPKESIKTSCKHIQQDVKRFVETLKNNALSNVNFSIIKKFKRIINTREYKKLVDFEK